MIFIKECFYPEKYKVKAIYGENGSGKTAIITAINIVKNVFLDADYLKQEINQRFLNEIINKKTKKFCFKAEYLYREDNNKLCIFSYSIVLKKNNIGKYEIIHEDIKEKNGNTNTNAHKDVFIIEKGTI